MYIGKSICLLDGITKKEFLEIIKDMPDNSEILVCGEEDGMINYDKMARIDLDSDGLEYNKIRIA